jgi:hypothetical protein
MLVRQEKIVKKLKILLCMVTISGALGLFSSAKASEVEDRLKPVLEKLGFPEGKMPIPKPAMGNYVDAQQVGKILYLSSAGPQLPNGDFMKGRVPDKVSVEDGMVALQLSCVRQLARIKQTIGDLDQVKRVIFLRGKVHTENGFTDLTKLVDACSALLVTAFGDAGRHTRTSEGYAALPFDLTSEIELTVELK